MAARKIKFGKRANRFQVQLSVDRTLGQRRAATRNAGQPLNTRSRTRPSNARTRSASALDVSRYKGRRKGGVTMSGRPEGGGKRLITSARKLLMRSVTDRGGSYAFTRRTIGARGAGGRQG